MRTGLRKFQINGMDAVSEELWQLYNYEALAPVDGKKKTREKKENGLDSLMLIKQKRDVKLKGRVCAVRRKQ